MAYIIGICFIIVILGIAYRLLLELQEWIEDVKRRQKRNQFDRYKVYEIQLKQNKDSNYENWYYAKVVILYIFGLIPIYAKFTCNRAYLDMRYWNNKEALLQELKRSSNAYSPVRKEKELKEKEYYDDTRR